MDFGKQLFLSQFGMIRMKGGHLSEYEKMPGKTMICSAGHKAKRWGKFRPRRIKRGKQTEQDGKRILASKFAGVVLISALSPQSAIRNKQYATERFNDWQENHPF